MDEQEAGEGERTQDGAVPIALVEDFGNGSPGSGSLSGSSLSSSLSTGSSSGGSLLLRVDACDPLLLSSSPDWISQPQPRSPSRVQPVIMHEPGVRQLGFSPRADGGLAAGHGPATAESAERDVLGIPAPAAGETGLRDSADVIHTLETLVASNTDSRTFFRPLLVGDEAKRKEALGKAMALLRQSADEEPGHTLVRAHVSTVVRLSIECPFPDVREACAELLAHVSCKNIGVTIPSQLEGFSYFVDASNSSLPSLLETSNDPALVAKLCRMAFLQRGRASHLVQLLAWHPSYLELFYHLFDFLMHGPGPLPLAWRSYICIMAASRSQCKYLVEMQEQVFPDLGGDPAWLEGLEHTPKKLRNLAEVNAILAHQPWRLQSHHISALVRGLDAWSMSELVQALVLLANTHSLAGLVYGCGITPEVEVEQLWCAPVDRPSAMVAQRREPDTTRDLFAVLSAQPEDEEDSEGNEEPQAQAFEIVDMDTQAADSLSSDDGDSQQRAGDSAADSTSVSGATADEEGEEESFSRYTGGVRMWHEDFDVHSHDYRIFHVSDYCWKEEAFALVSQYYTDAAPLLDELFSHIYHLTYRTFSSNEDVNTGPLRLAVWQYVHRVQGIFHDDYNYQKINRYLPRTMKTFIKKVCCCPEKVTAEDFHNIGIDLTEQEKCHLTLLIVEAKKQAELVYGLRAISHYLAGA